ncbi:MAG: hypothetical protein IKY72_08485 [Bacteroidaceae bacterium]|nr:hypothetical protein [Bacteroidaceae bacterium]
MKRFYSFYRLFALLLCMPFIACEENNGIDFEPQTYNVVGKVEKGPFVSGSEITIQPMSAKMQALGTMYTSTIQDHLGNFTFGSKLFESPYAELTANGYFFNEVAGALSSGTLYLRAIVDLSKSETVNVNILTHIKYQRVLHLIAQGKTYAEANDQAQKELFKAFGLEKYAGKDASLYSIIEGSDESAALVAISSLVLVERTEAAVTEYLARLCREFGENGEFSTDTKAQIKEDREKLAEKLSNIRYNIRSRYNDLGIDVEVPPLAPFFDWDDDGIAGNETLKEGETITVDKKLLEVPSEGGTYTIKIDAPIDVFLESQIESGPNDEMNSVYIELYKGYYSANLSYTADISDNVLSIKVNPASSRSPKTAYVYLYDFLGNTLDAISIKQDGATSITEIPQLGEYGCGAVAAMFSELAGAISYFNFIEQGYHYNEIVQCVDGLASPNDGAIAYMWEYFYEANNRNLQIREADRQALGVYGEVLDVFSAMIYYNMVVAWGDVPYVINYEDSQQNPYPSRTNQDAILDDLTKKLNVAIGLLEEKKNESLNLKKTDDMNKLFFVSKDVARILLADVYMYRGQYAEAQNLLKDVIDAGFYSLDATNYSNPETIDNLLTTRTSDEIIFALDASGGTRSTRSTNIIIRQSPLIPMMNYAEVLLSYAECLYHAGDTGAAEKVLRQVVDAKGIEIVEGIFEGIIDARQQLFLYSIGNFAFYKRNGIAVEELGIKEHQQLLPIPQRELHRNYNMTQNPGYDS